MQNSQMKRSQSIHLLMLGVLNLALSGLPHLHSLSDKPMLYYVEEECRQDTRAEGCPGVGGGGPGETKPPPCEGPSCPEEKAITDGVVRGGFGHSAGHYGGGALG